MLQIHFDYPNQKLFLKIIHLPQFSWIFRIIPTYLKSQISNYSSLYGINGGANTSVFEGFYAAKFVSRNFHRIRDYVIFDAGSHEGNWSLGFLKFVSKSSEITISLHLFDPLKEPENLYSEIHRMLENNFRFEYSYNRVSLAENSRGINLDSKTLSRLTTSGGIYVKSTTLLQYLMDKNISSNNDQLFILKLDIEGMEWETLDQVYTLGLFQVIQFEISPYTFQSDDSLQIKLQRLSNFYDFYVIGPFGVFPIEGLDLLKKIRPDSVTNLLAVEKLNHLKSP